MKHRQMNKDDISAWRGHPVTVEVFKFYNEYIQWLSDLHCDAKYDGKSATEIARKQAELEGIRFIMRDLMNFSIETMNETLTAMEPENDDEEIQQAGSTPD